MWKPNRFDILLQQKTFDHKQNDRSSKKPFLCHLFLKNGFATNKSSKMAFEVTFYYLFVGSSLKRFQGWTFDSST
jgi:hypothetical protein